VAYAELGPAQCACRRRRARAEHESRSCLASNTPGANRDSTINGLRKGSTGITLDGVSNNDNLLRITDGSSASITPRQGPRLRRCRSPWLPPEPRRGAAAAPFTMRSRASGGNRSRASGLRVLATRAEHQLTTSTRSTTSRRTSRPEPVGARRRHPIMIPGLYDGRNKAFFFFTTTGPLPPNSFTRTRNLQLRRPGRTFRYQCSTGTCSVNLLQLAAANGQISAKDPTMASLLAKINEAAARRHAQPERSALRLIRLQSPSELFEHQPTVRIDYNLNGQQPPQRVLLLHSRPPRAGLPESADPGSRTRPTTATSCPRGPCCSLTLRSLVKNNMTNELRGGLSAFYSGSKFGRPPARTPELADTFATSRIAIVWPGSLTNWYTSNAPSWASRRPTASTTPSTWVKGDHS